MRNSESILKERARRKTQKANTASAKKDLKIGLKLRKSPDDLIEAPTQFGKRFSARKLFVSQNKRKKRNHALHLKGLAIVRRGVGEDRRGQLGEAESARVRDKEVSSVRLCNNLQ